MSVIIDYLTAEDIPVGTRFAVRGDFLNRWKSKSGGRCFVKVTDTEACDSRQWPVVQRAILLYPERPEDYAIDAFLADKDYMMSAAAWMHVRPLSELAGISRRRWTRPFYSVTPLIVQPGVCPCQ